MPSVAPDVTSTSLNSRKTPKLKEEVNLQRRARKLSALAFMLYGLELEPDWIESVTVGGGGLAARAV
jgi:hypothetical protein